MLSDLRQSIRSLSRARGFTLAVVATLALGIGTATSIFTVADWVLFRSAPWPHKDRLFVIGSKSVTVSINDSGATANPFVTGVQFESCREQTDVFSSFAASQYDQANVVIGREPVQAAVEQVSAGFFPTLGIVPILGRGFRPEEFRPGADQVVVISHRFWQDHFGASADVLGRSLYVNQRAYTVIGVMAKNQAFPIFANADVCRPLILHVDPAKPWEHLLFVIGRLRSGVSRQQAQAALKAVKVDLGPQLRPKANEQELSLVGIDELKSIYRPAIYWTLIGAVGFLFAIACLNGTNLMLVRALGRRRELSIRLAMGGGRWRVVRLIVLESILLSAVACAVGAIITHWIFPILMRFIMSDSHWGTSVSLSWRVLGVMGALTVLTGVIVAVVPAAHVFRSGIVGGLKDGGVALGENPRLARLRNALVIFQAAFAVILLAGAGLMARTLIRLQKVDLGFDPVGRVKVQFSIPKGYHDEREDRLELFQRLQQRLRTVPGVKEVAFGSDALLAGYVNPSTQVRLPDGNEINIARDDVSYDYLTTAGLTLLRGNWLPARRDNGKQVVINESLAERVFGRHDPIGRAIDIVRDGHVEPWLVAGVVKDIRSTLRGSPAMHVYCSDWWWPPNLSTMVLRLDRDPGNGFEGQIRRTIYDFDPRLVVWNVGPIANWIDGMLSLERMTFAILELLSVIALALAIVGLFSVLAYSVNCRMGEFGLRLALGATPADLAQLVMRRGIVLAAIGIAAGVAGALGLTRFLRSLLYETTPNQPTVYLGVAMVLLVASAVACWLPARRAARTDVARLLRAE